MGAYGASSAITAGEPPVKILVVSPHFPYPPRSGFATRVHHLTQALATRHSVTLLTYAHPSDRDGAVALPADLTVHVVDRDQGSMGAKRVAQALTLLSPRPYYCRLWNSRQMQQAIDDLCSRLEFDLIQLESSFLCTFRFPPGARLVIDEHNIEYELFRRMGEGERSLPRRAFNWAEHGRFRHFEQHWWKQVDACVVTSEREGTIVRAHAPATPVGVVPNGVDLDYFAVQPHEVEPATLVFNATLTYRPNLDAALYLLDEIWPAISRRQPSARLTIVGRVEEADARRLRRPGVELLGEVPDVRPHLRRAAVVAVPVRIGSGTRLKVVEGLALGKALVSTSLGCEGLAVADGEHLLIADGEEAFAERVLELFADRARADALGRAGRRLVESNYSWELAGEALDALYARIGDTPPAARRRGSPRAAASVLDA
jgi:glycosyltransferase involved in cell wall biosynthesis